MCVRAGLKKTTPSGFFIDSGSQPGASGHRRRRRRHRGRLPIAARRVRPGLHGPARRPGAGDRRRPRRLRGGAHPPDVVPRRRHDRGLALGGRRERPPETTAVPSQSARPARSAVLVRTGMPTRALPRRPPSTRLASACRRARDPDRSCRRRGRPGCRPLPPGPGDACRACHRPTALIGRTASRRTRPCSSSTREPSARRRSGAPRRTDDAPGERPVPGPQRLLRRLPGGQDPARRRSPGSVRHPQARPSPTSDDWARSATSATADRTRRSAGRPGRSRGAPHGQLRRRRFRTPSGRRRSGSRRPSRHPSRARWSGSSPGRTCGRCRGSRPPC